MSDVLWKEKLFGCFKSKKVISLVVLAVFILGGGHYAYNYAGIVKIGKNSVAYSYGDVGKVYQVEQWIGDVIGSSVIKSRRDAFYYLVVSGIQKEILKGKDISVSTRKAIQSVESRTALKGLYAKIKRYLDDDYYRLFIEPMVINDVFAAYFKSNEPRKEVAQSIFQDALDLGLTEAAKKAEMKVVELFIPKNEQNAALVQELENQKGSVYKRIVESNREYSIIKPKDVGEKGVVFDAVVVRKKSLRQFLKDEMKNVPLEYSALSWYRENDLKKREGSIFVE